MTSRVARIALVATYCILLVLLFWSAASNRFQLPLAPIANPDTGGYLRPAVSKLSGGPFIHTNARNFVYPGFLFLILWTTKSFGGITIVQHLLGLGTGGLILRCWTRLGRFLRVIPRWLHAFLGLGVAATYLLASRPIYFEHDLRPEAITPFFALLNILLTLRFLQQRYHQPPSSAAAWTAAFLLINSVLLASIKTSFMLTIWFSIIPVFIALADRRETWRRRLAVLATGLIAAIAVLVPEHFLAKADPSAHAFEAESLFTIHAHLIAPQMEADVVRGDCAPYSCDWLREVAASLREEIAKSRIEGEAYASFGFDPDYLLYSRDSIRTWSERFFAGDYEKQLQFYKAYYWRAWRRHPGLFAQKIISEMGLFYTPRNPAFSRRKVFDMAPLYRRSAALLARWDPTNRTPIFLSYVEESARLSTTSAVIPQPLSVQLTIWFLSNAYRSALVCVLVLAGLILLRREWRQSYGLYALSVLFMFSYNFGNSLGTAVVHSLSIQRYSEAQYSFAVLSVCAGIVFIAEVALQVAFATGARFDAIILEKRARPLV